MDRETLHMIVDEIALLAKAQSDVGVVTLSSLAGGVIRTRMGDELNAGDVVAMIRYALNGRRVGGVPGEHVKSWHGCCTGDCPHHDANDCVVALADDLQESYNRIDRLEGAIGRTADGARNGVGITRCGRELTFADLGQPGRQVSGRYCRQCLAPSLKEMAG